MRVPEELKITKTVREKGEILLESVGVYVLDHDDPRGHTRRLPEYTGRIRSMMQNGEQKGTIEAVILKGNPVAIVEHWSETRINAPVAHVQRCHVIPPGTEYAGNHSPAGAEVQNPSRRREKRGYMDKFTLGPGVRETPIKQVEKSERHRSETVPAAQKKHKHRCAGKEKSDG